MCRLCGTAFLALPPYREGVPVARVVAAMSALLVLAGAAWGFFPELLGWLATPSMNHARDASRQSQTIGTLRKILSAADLYRTENGAYPPAARLEDLDQHLARYLSEVPHVDAWGNPLRCASDATTFVVGSAGSDGRWEHASLLRYEAGPTARADDDLIGRNGRIVRSPAS